MTRASVRSRDWRSVDDTAALRALVSRRLEADWPAVRIHPGDLDWWSVQAWGDDRPPVSERVRIWWMTGSDRPAAFAWFTPPGDVDLFVDAAVADGPARWLDDLHRELLAWAFERHAALAEDEEAPMRLFAVEGSAEAASLEARGLRVNAMDDGYVQLTGPLETVATGAPAIPDGLEVRPLTDADIPSRVRCGRAAFTTPPMTVERYRRTLSAGSYRAELDRVVLEGDGVVLAFALGWYDVPTRIVELEPVGVHPDHHRRGLGTLVCRDVLRVAGELGATRAMITARRRNEAAVGLYRSLGLAVTATIVSYELPVAPR